MNRKILGMACAGTLLPLGLAFAAEEFVDQRAQANTVRAPSREARQLVALPAPLRQRKLEEMRERLAIMGRLQAALSIEAYRDAGDLAEHHLGMSSLPMQATPEVAKYMPQAMREMETALHQAASRFAIEVTRAEASADARLANAALSEVMQRCVSCHAAYRFR